MGVFSSFSLASLPLGRALGVVITAGAILCLGAAPAAAQMMQQAPQITPAPESTPTPAPRYVPPPYMSPEQSDQGNQQPPPIYIPPLFIPQFVPTPYTSATPVPPPPPQYPMQARQPVLPPVFRGCWEGTVGQLDDIRRLPGAHKVGYWTPKTYKLCYRRVGSGPYDLTFGQTGVVASEKIGYSRGKVDVIETDGRTSAKLHAFLYFDEYRTGSGPGGPTFPVEEDTTLNCAIEGDSMRVYATVHGRRENQPWFKAHWHASFVRVPH